MDSEATILLVARDGDGTIVGSLTLAVFRVPTGHRAWIEDVVVDESARRAGAGGALVTAAIERADAAGARTVDLTSRPSREAANRLYLPARIRSTRPPTCTGGASTPVTHHPADRPLRSGR